MTRNNEQYISVDKKKNFLFYKAIEFARIVWAP